MAIWGIRTFIIALRVAVAVLIAYEVPFMISRIITGLFSFFVSFVIPFAVSVGKAKLILFFKIFFQLGNSVLIMNFRFMHNQGGRL